MDDFSAENADYQADQLASELIELNFTREQDFTMMLRLSAAANDLEIWLRTCVAVAARTHDSLRARSIYLDDLIEFSNLGLQLERPEAAPAIGTAHQVLTVYGRHREDVLLLLDEWADTTATRTALLSALSNVAADVGRYPS